MTTKHAGSIERRIDRLESIDEIRQLVAKFSVSLGMRDLDAHVNLFAPDIRVSRTKTGCAHLRRWLDDTLRIQFTGTSHIRVIISSSSMTLTMLKVSFIQRTNTKQAPIG